MANPSPPSDNQQGSFIHFFTPFTLFTLIIAGSTALVYAFLIPLQIPLLKLIFIFIVLYGVTLLVHYLLLRAAAYNPRLFIRYYSATTFVKLLVYFIFVLISTFSDRSNAAVFILTFFILYLAFTFFEVAYLMKQLKK
ncbi:MAG: hypothetical protein HYY40_12315 [Bacteroidetes bacterium]|nr:hypothetical protein [Bacteroidota bacterium]